MTDRRASMSPYHLEMLLFLVLNKSYWDVTTIEEMILKQQINYRGTTVTSNEFSDESNLVDNDEYMENEEEVVE